jgi:hypothetical protein
MSTKTAHNQFLEIKAYYDAVKPPKYRHVDLSTFRDKYHTLKGLKRLLGDDIEYKRLVSAMSQILSKLLKHSALEEQRTKGNIVFNFSERGTNKVVPAISKSMGTTFPVEWQDKWGNTCYVNNGYWGAKNYRVMDVISYFFLLKEGGDCLPTGSLPIFDDLIEIEQRESQLNNVQSIGLNKIKSHSVSFNDDDFRKATGLTMSSSDILSLLHETSSVEFKLTFPVRLRSTGNKENRHRMNYFSRFFELGYEDTKIKSNEVVLSRRYHIRFNTLLGELFVNNLLAKFNDRIDLHFYLLPDSAQIFYRRALLTNNFAEITFTLDKIAKYAGLTDKKLSNLTKTIEHNILEQLKEYRYIDSYEKKEGLNGIKYTIRRQGKTEEKQAEEAGSVNNEAGSVNNEAGSVNRNGS